MTDTVAAIVVTYNRKQLLLECVNALLTQTRPVDKILLIDNASTDGTADLLHDKGYLKNPLIEYIRLSENTGGAGGFHDGMKKAYEAGYEWIWLMDDDGIPFCDCLEKLLEHRSPNSIIVPLQKSKKGKLYGLAYWQGYSIDAMDSIDLSKKVISGDFIFSFVGPLIKREIVERIGLPNKSFFIWADDVDYAIRAKKFGKANIYLVPEAVFIHDSPEPVKISFFGLSKLRYPYPAWKTYYGVRNNIYILLKTVPNWKDFLIYIMLQLKAMIGDLIFEPEPFKFIMMRLKGILDGITIKMGKRV